MLTAKSPRIAAFSCLAQQAHAVCDVADEAGPRISDGDIAVAISSAFRFVGAIRATEAVRNNHFRVVTPTWGLSSNGTELLGKDTTCSGLQSSGSAHIK